MVRVISLSVLLTLIVVLGLTFYKVLAPFLLPLFLAAVFAILCEPIQAYFLKRTGGRPRLASGLTTASVIAVLMVPLIVGTVLASLQLFVLATSLADRNLTRTWHEQTEPILERAADFLNARLQPPPLRMEATDPKVDAESAQSASAASDVATGDEEARIEDDSAAAPPREPPTNRPAAGRTPAGPDPRPKELTGPDETPQVATTPAESGLPASDAQSDEPPATLVEDRTSTDSSVAALAPGSAASAESIEVPRTVTAEELRQRLEGWLRGSMTEIGRKSLGMAGGTLDLLSGSLVAVGSAVLGFVIFAIALYYFLADGTQLVRATERLIPVHVEYQRQMLGQFARVVRAVVMATFFAALAQSVATVVALRMFGFGHLLILFVLCLLMSMIPMLGTWLVWLPCAAYLAWQGHWFQAAVLSVYGTVFVGMLDNLVRTYVLNSDVKLHPLLALISVLGGLQVMGLWGMFVGPIVASCLHALVRIFNHELAALSEERFSGEDGAAADIPALAAAVDSSQSAGA